MSKANGSTPRIRYQCCACQFEFVPGAPGVAPCPRCQAIGGHEPVATFLPGGEYDGE